jgi:transcriptional regulator with XRE-family HTH domain
MGNNFQNISRIERGKLNPTTYWVYLLANAFDMSLPELFKKFEVYMRKQ